MEVILFLLAQVFLTFYKKKGHNLCARFVHQAFCYSGIPQRGHFRFNLSGFLSAKKRKKTRKTLLLNTNGPVPLLFLIIMFALVR